MAAAAYAAVVSLFHVLEQKQIEHLYLHRLHPDRNQIEILRGKVSFLQNFLEDHSQIFCKGTEDLARQIAHVANEAEDVIDIYVVDQLSRRSVDKSDMGLSSSFRRDISRVIEKMESIEKELMMVKEEKVVLQKQQLKVSLSMGLSSVKNSMVGFDEHLVRIMDELTGYKSNLQIIPIIGMGGIGKTTLARNVFDNPYIVHHFYTRVWLTIYQEYSVNQILMTILHEIRDPMGKMDAPFTDDELGEGLYKSLSGKRYLIVMDDVWSTKVWFELKSFFPDNRNGSRVMMTTRLSNVAAALGCQNPYLMDFLDEGNSWNLLCEKAFAQERCPLELEEIGKNIAKSCKGLPLAIVVIGGLLSNSDMTKEYWEFVANNINSFANSENDEHCLKILYLSYNHLPIHLKPCFLYTGVFPEAEIKVPKLIKLWVAGGFLKPVGDKRIETVAEEYLKDLTDRNLLLIRKSEHSRKMRTCSTHDLLRDLCLRESQKENFHCGAKVHQAHFWNHKYTCFLCSRWNASRRIYLPHVHSATQPTSLSSCLVCEVCRIMYSQLNSLKLVSIINNIVNGECCEEFLVSTKLRCLFLTAWREFEFVFTSIPLLWNLHTLVIDSFINPIILPPGIWEMPQLRHLKVGCAVLSDPPVIQIGNTDLTILKNLQTLSTIRDFRCSEEVLERIPNLKKLKIYYCNGGIKWSSCSIHNLEHLHQLESLSLDCQIFTWKKMAFSHSLKKLSLRKCMFPWKDMTIIGKLPNLEVLKLYFNAFKGPKWKVTEGEFLRLKVLLIEDIDLECWRANNVHFPNLESLVLRDMFYLKKIPSALGDIATLQLIQLVNCTYSVVNSAQEILKEQQSLGNDGLLVHVSDIHFGRSIEYENVPSWEFIPKKY